MPFCSFVTFTAIIGFRNWFLCISSRAWPFFSSRPALVSTALRVMFSSPNVLLRMPKRRRSRRWSFWPTKVTYKRARTEQAAIRALQRDRDLWQQRIRRPLRSDAKATRFLVNLKWLLDMRPGLPAVLIDLILQYVFLFTCKGRALKIRYARMPPEGQAQLWRYKGLVPEPQRWGCAMIRCPASLLLAFLDEVLLPSNIDIAKGVSIRFTHCSFDCQLLTFSSYATNWDDVRAFFTQLQQFGCASFLLTVAPRKRPTDLRIRTKLASFLRSWFEQPSRTNVVLKVVADSLERCFTWSACKPGWGMKHKIQARLIWQPSIWYFEPRYVHKVIDCNDLVIVKAPVVKR